MAGNRGFVSAPAAASGYNRAMRHAVLALSLTVPVAAAAGLCDAPSSWQGEAGSDIPFATVQLLDPALRGDGLHDPVTISLADDVLSEGAMLLLAPGVEARVICIRSRPEWLGLRVVNEGEAVARGRMTVATGGATIDAEVPPVPSGETRLILLQSSHPLAEVEREAVSYTQGG